jgi:hypothetical protein
MLGGLRRWWRDKIASPTLRSYDTARDELGGEPWRPMPEATDRWFLADRPPSFVGRPPSVELLVRPPSVEAPAFAPAVETGPFDRTAAFDLRPRLARSTKLALVGAVVFAAIVYAVVALLRLG